jgi:pyridoxamine 5'-phosphate oxidase
MRPLSWRSLGSQNDGMPHTLWRPSLILAHYRNRGAPSSRLVQLATVRPDGRPANRTLAFHGFLNDTHRLVFGIDSRSAKVAELARTPWAEICWYFPVTHEQFRISGPTTVSGGDEPEASRLEARRESWRSLSDSARLIFAWPHPGEPLARRAEFASEAPSPDEPLANFCLLVLDPQLVDHLELNGSPQNRWLFQADAAGVWSAVEVNP